MRSFAILLAYGALACAAATSPRPTGHPPRVEAAPSGWLTRLDRDHALVGKIWDARAAAFVTEAQLFERLRGARFVLLGERHDNPDHHRLQGHVVAALARSGRRFAVVLEMLEISQQADVDRYRKQVGASAESFGSALGGE
jgi:uncharacterized iron-regulated protein